MTTHQETIATSQIVPPQNFGLHDAPDCRAKCIYRWNTRAPQLTDVTLLYIYYTFLSPNFDFSNQKSKFLSHIYDL